MSWFETEGKATDLETAQQANTPFFAESGEYTATIEFACVYASPDSQSKGLYIRFVLDNGVTFDQYVNFINREGNAFRVVKDEDGKEKKVKGLGLDQIESWDKIVKFGKPTIETQATLWGRERQVKLLGEAIGKKVGVLVRHVKEPNQDGSKVYDKNEADALFDLQTRKTSGQLYFKEEDNRSFSIADWLKRIEKNPTLDRTNKKTKPKAYEQAKKEAENAGW